MSLTDSVASIAKKLLSATATVIDGIAALRVPIAETQAALTLNAEAYVPVDEAIARWDDHCRATGEEYLHKNGAIWLGCLGSPKGMRVPFGMHVNEGVPFGLLCLCRPEIAHAFGEVMIRCADYVPGAPAGERAGERVRLARVLVDAEAAEEAAVDAACAAGVVVAHRPEVVVRRANEARALELNAARDQDARGRQVAVDEAYGPPRAPLHDERPHGGGESPYLAANRADRPPQW